MANAAAIPVNPGAGAAATPAADADVATLPVQNTFLLTIGIMTATLLQILDTTITTVAIPHMQAALGATSDEISWVLTSYIVATAVAMPITGWLADRIGSRRLFIGSAVAFVLASMLCGLAQNLTQMVAFRALQGIAGAFIAPLGQAAMIDTNKPSRQAQMMALWGMGIMIGPILGPILGGWLTENWNWRWVFYVNVPIGALSVFLLVTLLPSRPIVRRRFDLTGFALIAVTLTSIQLLLDRGNRIDWFDAPEAWIYAMLAISAAWVGVIHFATAKEPLFDRKLFADPNFSIAMVMSVGIGIVMFSTMALLPPMLQHLFGYGVIDTGMTMMPRGVGTLIAMQLSSIALRRGVDGRKLMVLGYLIAAWSLYDMSTWSLAVDNRHIVTAAFVQGFGMGLTFITMNSIAFATLSPRLRTEGSSLLNLARSIGSSVGISIVISLLAANIQISHQDLAGHITSSVTDLVDVSTIDRFQTLGTSALALIDGEINRQAAMIAYVDDFRLTMWLSLACVPLILLMRKATAPSPTVRAPEAH